MTVSSTVRSQTFSGGQSVLTFNFRTIYNQPSYINVNLVSFTGGSITPLVYNVGYTVAINSSGIGGTVTISPTYSSAYNYVVYRNTPLTQESAYSDYNAFPASTLENDLDQLTLIDQENSDDYTRSLQIPIGTTPTISTVLPIPTPQSLIGWDTTGTILTNYLPATLNFIAVSSTSTLGTSDGVVPTQHAVATFIQNYGANVLFYGATGNGTTDDTAAIQAAINSVKTTGGKVFFPVGLYLCTSPLNLTGIDQGITIQGASHGAYDGTGTGCIIIFKHTGVGFDMSGSNGITFRDICVKGNSTTVPKCAFFMARNAAGSSAGLHRFFNVMCDSLSQFSVSVVYSYGAEEVDYFGCNFFNNYSAGKIIYSTAYNTITTISSTYITIATGAQSNSTNNFYGCSLYCQGGANSDIFYFDGVEDMHIYGGLFVCFTGTTNGRSYIYVDTTNSSSDNISIDGVRGEIGTYAPSYGIYFNNTTSVVPTNWSITNSRFNCITNTVYASNNSQLNYFNYRGIVDTTAVGVSVYNMELSHLDMGNAFFTCRSNGTLTSCELWGNITASFTLSGSALGTILHDYQYGGQTYTATGTGGVTGKITLHTSSTTTIISNTVVTTASTVILYPTSAASAAIATSTYISSLSASTSFTVSHPSNTSSTLTFSYLVLN